LIAVVIHAIFRTFAGMTPAACSRAAMRWLDLEVVTQLQRRPSQRGHGRRDGRLHLARHDTEDARPDDIGQFVGLHLSARHGQRLGSAASVGTVHPTPTPA
jgi:hypothetical protein